VNYASRFVDAKSPSCLLAVAGDKYVFVPKKRPPKEPEPDLFNQNETSSNGLLPASVGNPDVFEVGTADPLGNPNVSEMDKPAPVTEMADGGFVAQPTEGADAQENVLVHEQTTGCDEPNDVSMIPAVVSGVVQDPDVGKPAESSSTLVEGESACGVEASANALKDIFNETGESVHAAQWEVLPPGASPSRSENFDNGPEGEKQAQALSVESLLGLLNANSAPVKFGPGGHRNKAKSLKKGEKLTTLDEAERSNAPLGSGEVALLADCEKTILLGVEHVLRAALALAVVRDRQLYRVRGYKSFIEYVRVECDYAKSHAYRLLDYAGVCRALNIPSLVSESPNGGRLELPNERQARDLNSLGCSAQELQTIWCLAHKGQKRVNRVSLDKAIEAVAGKKSLKDLEARRRAQAGRPKDSGVFIKVPAELVGKIEVVVGKKRLDVKQFSLDAIEEKIGRGVSVEIQGFPAEDQLRETMTESS